MLKIGLYWFELTRQRSEEGASFVEFLDCQVGIKAFYPYFAGLLPASNQTPALLAQVRYES